MKHITKPDDDLQELFIIEHNRKRQQRKHQMKIHRLQASSYLHLYIVTLGKYFKTMLSREV